MVMMEETYHQMESEEGEPTSGSGTYSNVLEKSTLRPDVEPFVPKLPGAPGFLMMGQSPFSLDAPEFVPAYYTGGDMYSWSPTPNQFLVQTVNHPRLLIPRFRRKYIGQQQRNNRGGTYNRNNRERRYEDSTEDQDSERNYRTYHNGHKEVERKYTRSEERPVDHDEASRRGARSYSSSRHQRLNHGKSNENKQVRAPQRNGSVEIHPSEAISITTEHKLLTPDLEPAEVPVPDTPYPPVLSYRAALVGKAAKSVTGSVEPVPVEKSDRPDGRTERPEGRTERPEGEWVQSAEDRPDTEWVQVERKRHSSQRQDEKAMSGEENQKEKVEKVELTRWENKEEERRRAERGAPGAERGAPGFRGRPKPTRGSGIQLNIFSMIQVSEDKKGKKKKVGKVSNARVKSSTDCTKIIVKEKEDHDEPLHTNGKAVDGKLHNRQFREYCAQVVTTELNTALASFLTKLREFNDRAYKQGSTRRRYCCGLREAEKYLKLKKVKCLVIPPNIEKIVTKGGLDDCISDIISLSRSQDVPIYFGLNKTLISKLLARPKSTITSAVSIFNYDGAEVLWKEVQVEASKAKDLYQLLAEADPGQTSSSSEGEEFDEDNNTPDGEGEESHDADQSLRNINNHEADQSLRNNHDADESLRNSDISNLSHSHLNNGTDNESVSSSFIDSGIENGMISEISSMSIDNDMVTDEGERSTLSDGER